MADANSLRGNTRRKQANPRRKNVDEDDIMGEEQSGNPDENGDSGAEDDQSGGSLSHRGSPSPPVLTRASTPLATNKDTSEDCSNLSPLSSCSERKNCDHSVDTLVKKELGSGDDGRVGAMKIEVDVDGFLNAKSESKHLKQEDSDQVAEPLTSEFILKCPHCQEPCRGVEGFRNHIASQHCPITPQQPPSSPLSINGFLSHQNPLGCLTPSLLLRSENGIVQCDKCGMGFSSREGLEQHEIQHCTQTAQVVICKVCQKTFANVYRLQRHMISHDESAVLRKFKCPECEKAFKFKHHLKEHIRIHSGEKPFECPNCGKRFSHSGSFSSHMTSKKCLIMNLKVRGRSAANNGSPITSQSQQLTLPLKSTPRQTAFMPIMPKVDDSLLLTPPLLAQNMISPDFVPFISTYSTLNLQRLAYPYGLDLANGWSHLIRKNSDSGFREEPPAPVNQKSPSVSPGSTSNDLQAVNKILEAVNATVIKQQINGNKHDGGGMKPAKFVCSYCKDVYDTREALHNHEQFSCKMSDNHSVGSIPLKSGFGSSSGSNNGYGMDYEDGCSDDDLNSDSNDGLVTMKDGHKVRVRSLISDQQFEILKSYYEVNQKPKKAQLLEISQKIGYNLRVVQVWFQNMRARDRKLNRLNIGSPEQRNGIHYPEPKPAAPFSFQYKNPFPDPFIPATFPDDQPLDLSKPRTEPEPRIHQVLNLSLKSPQPEPNWLASQQESNMSRLQHLLSQPALIGFPEQLAGVMIGKGRSNSCSSLDSNSYGAMGDSEVGSEVQSPRSDHQGSSPNAVDLVDLKRVYPKLNGNIMDESYAENQDPSRPKKPRKPRVNGRLPKTRVQDGALGESTLDLSPRSSTELNGEGDGMTYGCKDCDKVFNKQSSLIRHKYEHSGQRPYQCDECPKAFKHKHHLTEHRRLHSGEKPFQCNKCLKRFSHSGSYSQHMSHRYNFCKPYRDNNNTSDAGAIKSEAAIVPITALGEVAS